MASRSRILFFSGLCLLSAGTVAFLVKATGNGVADKPIAPFQKELLDIAFRAPTKLPVDPHIKNRSRAQEAVVKACLQLDQPRRALADIEAIDNWRRGAGYADLAFYCAQHGETTQVQHYLDLAGQIAESGKHEGEEDEGPQGWQRDRIRACIAKTHILLGQDDEAAPFEANLGESEVGPVEAMKATFVDAETCDAQIHALDAIVAKGSFEQIGNALQASAQLFDRFYEDGERRSRVESKIKDSWQKTPLLIHIELMMQLTGFALDHGDRSKALELVEDTRLLVESSHWSPEDHVPLLARLARLRFQAGDEGKARAEADAALGVYDAARDDIVNIYRARALRPLAEAYQSMGDSAAALSVYKRAVEEGVENPNSRPRAEDLSATCCSMALSGLEPDDSLRARILEIYEGLGSPW